jgi:polyisoprenoid-binding protein YceI
MQPSNQEDPMLEREHWEIDGANSTLTFALRHFVVGEIKGQFERWGGTLLLDPAHVSRSSLEVWVDVASLDTGSPERDAHLRSPELLDVARSPLALFRSTGLALHADGKAAVAGRLELHGVTRHVELAVMSQGSWGVDKHELRAEYAAHTGFDRQEFGLHWNQDLDIGGFVVGDRVELTARVQMVRFAEIPRTPEPEPPAASAG